jgi:hypothetical protein
MDTTLTYQDGWAKGRSEWVMTGGADQFILISQKINNLIRLNFITLHKYYTVTRKRYNVTQKRYNVITLRVAGESRAGESG